MNCPACFTMSLEPYRDDDISLEIDSCKKCGGLWFDARELSTFLKSDPLKQRFLWVEAEEAPPARERHALDIVGRNCPRDRMVMQERVFAGVTLDRCPQCHGLWFDDGEVRQVVDRWKRGLGKGESEVANELREGFTDRPADDERRRGMMPGVLAFMRHAFGA